MDLRRGSAECRHCGIRPSLPFGSACETCFNSVKTKFLDFRCSDPGNCPHKVSALAPFS